MKIDFKNIEPFLSELYNLERMGFNGKISVSSPKAQIVETFYFKSEEGLLFSDKDLSFKYRILRLIEVLIFNEVQTRQEVDLRPQLNSSWISLENFTSLIAESIKKLKTIYNLRPSLIDKYIIIDNKIKCEVSLLEKSILVMVQDKMPTSVLLVNSEYSLFETILCLKKLEKMAIIGSCTGNLIGVAR